MFPSAPVGPAAWVCLILGTLGCVPVVNRWLSKLIFESSRRAYVSTLATLCFALSVAYVQSYLRGGPRIIDATSYLLQAKTFASGHFAFAPPGALHSYAGRFLVVTPDGGLSVLFPPGFAAVLAIGVVAGAPLLVNPLVGALLSCLTYRLGAQWFSERCGRIAGVLSTLCACLRYHSADTMSHAWSATLVLGVLICATRTERASRWSVLVAGICAGWLFATRPVTGLVCGGAGLVLVCLYPTITRLGSVLAYLSGAVPGVALWLGYQWVTTGSVWNTTQSLYYERSDWPFGCFRLAMGSGIGCRFEHGHFVDQFQPRGFGLLEALQVTLRRLWLHQRDITNVPWLASCLLLAATGLSFARARARFLLLLVGAHVASYAFFYFDGNYPGGGARLFVDILPLEQVLLCVVFTRHRVERLVPSACCVGFALWGAVEHQALATRDGGKPMFEPQVLEDAGVRNGLVFVQTDHGFNLGFEPNAVGSSTEAALHVARLRNDGFDFATWQQLGQPPTYLYRFAADKPAPTLATLAPHLPPNTLTFAGRSFWAPTVEGGSTIPVHNPDGLRLIPHAGQTLEATIELPISRDDHYHLEVDVDLSSPTTLDVPGWTRGAERGATATKTLTFGPRFLSAGKSLVALRSQSEMTIARLALVRASRPLEAAPRTP